MSHTVTLEDLLAWHEKKYRIAYMSSMMSAEAMADSQFHKHATTLIKQLIADRNAPTTAPPGAP
jgi:hypothetical protein